MRKQIENYLTQQWKLGRQTVTISEISDALNIPESTIQPITTQLKREGKAGFAE